jgi:hypothetical protein
LEDGRLVTVVTTGTGAGAYSLQSPIGQLAQPATAVAVDVSAKRAAMVVGDRSTVVVGGIMATGTLPVDATWFQGGERLLKPSWDGQNVLWLVDRTSDGAVVRVATRNAVRVVDAPGVAGQDVRWFAVSRDGMRFAAVIGRGSESRLVVAMVRRDPSHRLDVSLTGIQPVANAAFPLVDITRLAWYSPTVIALLARVEGSEPQPYQITIDGSSVQPTTGFLPVRPVSLAAGADPDIGPVIGTGDGRLYIRTPSQQWPAVVTRDNVRLLAPTYPG